MTDKSDRIKIRGICNLLGLIWKDQWFETDNFITIPACGMRYWFATEDGVEYIERVEEFSKTEAAR